MTLTTGKHPCPRHLHLVLRLIMSGSIPLPPLCAFLVWIRNTLRHAAHMKPEIFSHHFILRTFPRHSRTKIIQFLSFFLYRCYRSSFRHNDQATRHAQYNNTEYNLYQPVIVLSQRTSNKVEYILLGYSLFKQISRNKSNHLLTSH